MERENTMSDYRFVFIGAQLLHGIGAAALTTLGTTLMDESVPEKEAPFYIGIFEASFVLGPALGYVAGGRLLNIFTEFYLLDEVDLSPDSSYWVGAWWLGFILIFVLSLVCAGFLALFPASIGEKRRKTAAGMTSDKNPLNALEYVGLLQGLPGALYNLISNATYTCISLGASLDGFLLAGMAAFLPKYFEAQFDLSPGDAAMLVGVIVVPAGAGGTLIGGYVAKKLCSDRAAYIKMYIVCQMLVLPLYLGFFLHCDNHKMADFSRLECSRDCPCAAPGYYDPVCIEGGVNYPNPCLAGCSTGNLTGCLCGEVTAKGFCKDQICDKVKFSLVVFFQIFFTFAGTMPALVASLRSVEESEKSLSVGLQTMMMRGLGTVPGPIVFGAIVDSACIMWSDYDECEGTYSGNCLSYDRPRLSMLLMALMLAWRFTGALFFGLALYFNKTSKVIEGGKANNVATTI